MPQQTDLPGTSTAPLPAFEKLGAFYLGRAYDLASKKATDELVLYDSKDLITHAVCVGMTGSGKTGLCLSLLEEAAIDGIPAVVIDPKGDLCNLLLTFPALRGEDFRPWINEDDARRRSVDPDEFAAQQAELWRTGLAEWGQDGARIRRLRDAAEFTIYTPGGSAGVPVSVLKSFAAPPSEILDEAELLRERIATTATSLLGLMGIAADPIQSREHILLSTILGAAWTRGQDLDLPALIQQIQKPPVQRIGVMELESVYPAKDRFTLAMALNNVVAAPGFASWMEGEALDIGALLHAPSGRPRVAIFSIAHLGDAERMFFVSLLLNQMLGWTRSQSGTTSLRAILYMDEIAGYFPPTANPPSKTPLLTLMKQARAFGVGVVLATQNPVDLDYKGLSNAGTWFIGRLQTQRDKDRVLDGLEGASAQASSMFDRRSVDSMLSQLGSRVFLMNNIHDEGPTLFQTRWALSYLRGPLTRNQIRALMAEARRPASRDGSDPATSAAAGAAPQAVDGAAADPRATSDAAGAAPHFTAAAPLLPEGIQQFFLSPPRGSSAGGAVEHRPALLGLGRVHYSDARTGIESDEDVALLATLGPGPVILDWTTSETVELRESDLEAEPPPGALFAPLPSEASRLKSYDGWRKAFADALFRTRRLDLLRSPHFKLVSAPGEGERAFRLRLEQAAREERDVAVEKLRGKYAAKAAALQERLRRAQQQRQAQEQQASAATSQAAVSFGSAILSALLGRKAVSTGSVGKAATAARRVGRMRKESGDVTRAAETVEAVRAQVAALNDQVEAEVADITARIELAKEALEPLAIKPKRADIAVRALVLLWVATPAPA
jgi:hypothetical protein